MEHIILGLILLICVVLLVAGLRMMSAGLRILELVTREVGEVSAQTKATLDAVSLLLRDKK